MFSVPLSWINANANMLCPITTMRGYIASITPAVTYRWEKDRFRSLQIKQHGDLLSGAIPDYELIVEVDNSGSYLGDAVITREMIPKLHGLQFYIEYGYSGISDISDVRHFISDVEIKADTGTVIFTAKSSLAFMTNTYASDAVRHGSAKAVAEGVIAQAIADDSVPKPLETGLLYEIDDSISNLHIWLDDDNYSMVEVLQIIANATRCILRVDGNGKILIEPRNKEIQTYSIPRLVQYSQPVESVDPPIIGCKVYCRNGNAEYASTTNKGKYEIINNYSLVYDSNDTVNTAKWVVDELAEHPQLLSCVFRADPRAEIFDTIQFDNSGEIRKIVITDLSYTYNGAWAGEVTGRDNGDGFVGATQELDVYNSMMEYLASIQNGSGAYQPYTESYRSLLEHLGKTILATWGTAYASGITWGEAAQYKWEDAGT